MLVRIVKMTFQKDKINNFEALFDEVKHKIRNSPGCRLLELYQDQNNPQVFFTYSYWVAEEDLENYRHSPLFNEVWTKTKAMFAGKPEAWSVDKKVSLK
ncbi:antibiotic biosynthesis monooxygenase [Gangjinia marincola]|uniref:Antibiotic biosynthesis monooxygenase n=1 Tax=Gangjinia marincola TaxID=578463 RepID=A0ABP3XUS7_9FLAO